MKVTINWKEVTYHMTDCKDFPLHQLDLDWIEENISYWFTWATFRVKNTNWNLEEEFECYYTLKPEIWECPKCAREAPEEPYEINGITYPIINNEHSWWDWERVASSWDEKHLCECWETFTFSNLAD